LQLGTLSQKPDQVITREQLIDGKYLPDIKPPKGCKLLATKALHGMGKTEQYARNADHRRRECGVWLPILYGTHRVQLSVSGGSRLGLEHADTIAAAGSNPVTTGYSVVFDSMKFSDHAGSQSIFKVEDWHDAIVVFDEIEQALQHLLFSATLGSHRIEIMRNFAQLIRNVAASQHGLIIIGDADLSDISIALLQALSGGLLTSANTHIVEAEKPERSARMAHFYPTIECVIDGLNQAIMMGDRVIIHTSAQKEKSKWSSINIEKYLAAKYPDCSIIRIDSQTVNDPDHPAYGGVSAINQLVAKYQIIIASPVIETGVSIDQLEKEFAIDSVWYLGSGLQAEQSVRQTLERVRSDVPRHLYVPTGTGLGQIGNGSESPYFVSLGEDSKAKASDTLASYKAAAEADHAEDMKAFMTAWCDYAACLNSGKKDYRNTIVRSLRAAGYQITEAEALDKATKTEIADTFDEIKNGSWDAKNAAVANSTGCKNQDEAMRLDNRDRLSPAEGYKLRKWKLSERYSVEQDDVTAALDHDDDEGCYSKLQLHFWLTAGREQLADRDDIRRNTRRRRDQLAWLPDANRELLKGKVEALESLGIPELIETIATEPDRCWHKFSPELMELRDRFVANRHRFGDVIGCSITGSSLDNPVAIARSILGKVGIELIKPEDQPKQVRLEDGSRIRQYQLGFEFAEVFGDRVDQFDRWHHAEIERITEWNEKELIRIEAEAAAAAHPPGAIEPEREERIEPEPEPITINPAWIDRYRSMPPENRSAWLGMFAEPIALAVATAAESIPKAA
jgi:3-dehydroquinate dehydratase